tara:strand:- start:577 stop:792 length:216 start_codon:yes stop_codon:yes gene_type:complete
MLKTDDLDPDGVRIVVNWENMVVNASIFIPCINVEKAKNQIYKITKAKNWEIIIRATIENNKFGLRIWRMT